jgi:hypothetical protein
MFIMAPETKGRTLEEMDVVFEIPAWKKAPRGSELEKIAEDIEAGNLKVQHKFGGTTSHREDTTA